MFRAAQSLSILPPFQEQFQFALCFQQTHFLLQASLASHPSLGIRSGFSHFHTSGRRRSSTSKAAGHHPKHGSLAHLISLNPQGEELELRFCHDTLARIPLELPLLLACQEARAIALTWAYNQYGVIVRRNGISKIFGFSRDVLYISLAAFDEFCKDPYDKWETDLNSDRTFMSPSSVRKITVHAEMFDDLWNTYSFGLMLVSI